MFTYFLPDHPHSMMKPDQLPPILAHLGKERIHSRWCHEGPSGGRGLLVNTEGNPSYSAKDTWKPMKDPEGKTVAWIGYATLPTPHELLRDEYRTGHEAKLADGRLWIVPIARMWTEAGHECALPRGRKLDEKGRWYAGEVIPKYRDLWAAACAWWDRKYAMMIELANAGGGFKEFTVDKETSAAVLALSINYRVSAAECEILGILDDDAVVAVMDALVDLRSFDLLVAKKALAAAETKAAAQIPAA